MRSAPRKIMASRSPVTPAETLTIDGREVHIGNPHKVLFPQAGYTKLDVARYFLEIAGGALRGSGGRPNTLVRYPDGIDGKFFFQKRAPTARPAWLEVVTIRFPSGRTADEIVPRHAADLAWLANLACLELHPHPVRATDLDHPDELRIDLDPTVAVPWSQVRDVAGIVKEVLEQHGLRGWPKTSGKRGLHVLVRIQNSWTHDRVRRAALALAREVERRVRGLPQPSGGRRNGTACSSTTTRMRRTERWPGPIRSARRAMRGFPLRCTGRRSRRAIPPLSR